MQIKVEILDAYAFFVEKSGFLWYFIYVEDYTVFTMVLIRNNPS